MSSLPPQRHCTVSEHVCSASLFSSRCFSTLLASDAWYSELACLLTWQFVCFSSSYALYGEWRCHLLTSLHPHTLLKSDIDKLMEWSTIPVCPSLMCFLNRGDTKGTNSSEILCSVFVYVWFNVNLCQDWFCGLQIICGLMTCSQSKYETD